MTGNKVRGFKQTDIPLWSKSLTSVHCLRPPESINTFHSTFYHKAFCQLETDTLTNNGHIWFCNLQDNDCGLGYYGTYYGNGTCTVRKTQA